MDWANIVMLLIQMLRQAPQLAGLIEQIWNLITGHIPAAGHTTAAVGPTPALRQQMTDAIAAAQKTALQP